MEKIVWLRACLNDDDTEPDTSEVNKLLEQGWRVKEISTSAAGAGAGAGDGGYIGSYGYEWEIYGQVVIVLTKESSSDCTLYDKI